MATGHTITTVITGVGYGSCGFGQDFRTATAAAAILAAGETAERLFLGYGSFEGARIDRDTMAQYTTDPNAWAAGGRMAELILVANARAVLRLADHLAANFTTYGAEVAAVVGTLNTPRGF